MNNILTAQAFLEQILQIQQMEHGSLSVAGHGPNGPYFNLNSWENGKNCCRYIPNQKVQGVKQAIEAYHKYQQLTEQYAQQIINKTRKELDIDVKKKPQTSRKSPPASSRPRKQNSNK